jgi:hypothetical protein
MFPMVGLSMGPQARYVRQVTYSPASFAGGAFQLAGAARRLVTLIALAKKIEDFSGGPIFLTG